MAVGDALDGKGLSSTLYTAPGATATGGDSPGSSLSLTATTATPVEQSPEPARRRPPVPTRLSQEVADMDAGGEDMERSFPREFSRESLRASLKPNASVRASHGAGEEQQHLRAAWAGIAELVVGLFEALDDAHKAVACGPNDPQMSATTRKKLGQRVQARVTSARGTLEDFASQFGDLRTDTLNVCEKLAASEAARRATLAKLEHAGDEMREMLGALKLSESRQAEAAAAAANAAKAADALEREAVTLRAENAALVAEYAELKEMTGAAQAEAAEARQMAGELHARAERHHAAMTEAKAQLEGLGEARAAAEDTLAKYKDTVARLTADNVVFLMRLKGAEADLAATKEENAQLRAAAERSEGVFFDRARAEVQRTVQGALSRVEELEGKLGAHDEEARAAERTAAERLAAVTVRAEAAEAAAAAATAEAERRAAAATAAAAAAAAARDAERALREEHDRMTADARVRSATLVEARDDAVRRQVEAEALSVRLHGAKEEGAALRAALGEAEAAARRAAEELALQKKINHTLMHAKEKVEWELMEATVRLEGRKGAQVPGATPVVNGPTASDTPVAAAAAAAAAAADTAEAAAAPRAASPTPEPPLAAAPPEPADSTPLEASKEVVPVPESEAATPEPAAPAGSEPAKRWADVVDSPLSPAAASAVDPVTSPVTSPATGGKGKQKGCARRSVQMETTAAPDKTRPPP